MVDIEYIKNPPAGGNRFYGSDYGREQMVLAAKKITDLQAKLDKAVEALKEVIKCSDQSGIPGYRQCWECADTNKISKQALAAIEGASHE